MDWIGEFLMSYTYNILDGPHNENIQAATATQDPLSTPVAILRLAFYHSILPLRRTSVLPHKLWWENFSHHVKFG